MRRLHEELGMAARYRADGSAALIWPDGQEIQLQKDDGLQYIKWIDFIILRDEHIKSHLKGRPRYTGTVEDPQNFDGMPPGLFKKIWKTLMETEVTVADKTTDGNKKRNIIKHNFPFIKRLKIPMPTLIRNTRVVDCTE